MHAPLTVVIATRDRWPDLRRTLGDLRSHPVGGVVVVDNGSTDETRDRLSADYPEVQLIRIEVNEGVPAFGRGLAAVQTPYALLLDDDASPRPGTIATIVETFEADPLAAIVACHVDNSGGGSVTAGWPPHPICFWGCGAGVRLSAIVDEPYLFDPRLVLHGTEMDLAIRLYARGRTVRYEPQAIVVHRVSAANRSARRRMRHLAPAAMWFPVKHLPWEVAGPALVRHLTLLACRAAAGGVLRAYLAGVVAGIRGLPGVVAERRPVDRRLAALYRDAVWEYEPLTRRVRRHVTGRPVARAANPLGYTPIAAGRRPSGRSPSTDRLSP